MSKTLAETSRPLVITATLDGRPVQRCDSTHTWDPNADRTVSSITVVDYAGGLHYAATDEPGGLERYRALMARLQFRTEPLGSARR